MGRKAERKETQRQAQQNWAANEDTRPPAKHQPIVTLNAKTRAQGEYLVSMQSNQLTFGVGPAGTGKTYVCTAFATQQLVERRISKIIVTRPAIEAGQGLGFLPGTLEEKFAPYFAPFKHVFESLLGKSHLENLIRNERIEIAPLEFIRGLTFDDCFVILDEAQNTTPEQMKLFLTRLGEHSRVVINGDVTQKDIKVRSGLEDALARLDGLKGVCRCDFSEEDIVRSGLVKEILKRYRK